MRAQVLLVSSVLVGCSGSSVTTGSPITSSTDASASAGTDGSTSTMPGATPDAATPGSSASDAGAPTDASSPLDAGMISALDDGSAGAAPTIPKPTGTCPTIAPGDLTFSPAGIAPRTVTLSMSATAPAKPGPLIFYWYATGSSVAEIPYALNTTLPAIEAAGGVVAAPHADPDAGQFEWYIVDGSQRQDDFLVADEVVACLAQAGRIDPAHVHAMGMSAGALQTTYMSFNRSTYLASVTTYSGGVPSASLAPPFADPANKFSALLFEGGSTDQAFGFDFQGATLTYRGVLEAAGHFAPLCDHGMGHAIPTAAAPSVWQFFQANGFGVYPSPYANGLPAGFPSYCTTGDAGQ